jgi:hypothetical protein
MIRGVLLSVFILLTILFISLVSCTATGGKGVIQPLGNIPGGFEGPYFQDIGAHSVKIVFKTRVPVVCNVAYGLDKTYGKLALMAMTGPVTDHEISLLGLEPDSVYHLRITITDAESNVYQSEDLTFSTIQGTGQKKPVGTNVVSANDGAKVVGVSSNWGGGGPDSSFGANKAIDGNSSTEWSSDSDGDNAWIEIELAQLYELDTIGFWTRTMGNSAQIFTFKVVTDDGTQLGPFNLPDAATIYYFDADVKAKRLRFKVESSSGGNTGAVEIEVYTK